MSVRCFEVNVGQIVPKKQILGCNFNTAEWPTTESVVLLQKSIL